MTKLKIGTVKPKEEEKKDDYFSELSDEELQTIQEEVEAITEETVDEVAPITEEMIEEITDEEEAEEAINGVDILDKAGIHADYIKKFTELYPKKKIIYHFLITKQFLEWYIKNVKPSLLNKLEIISEYVNPVQQANFLKLIKKRLSEDIELEEVKTDVEQETTIINLKTEQEIEMYELLLNEKWDKNRAKGIIELDSLIMEQLRLKEIFTIQEALEFLIETFKLEKKLKKRHEVREEKKKELIETIKPKEKRMTPAEEKVNIKNSIIYFRHLKFLYKLMGDKMIFSGEMLTQEEIKKIETITNLIENRTKTTPTKKKNKKEESRIIMDNFH